MSSAPSSPVPGSAPTLPDAVAARGAGGGVRTAHLAIDARMVRHSGIGTYLRELVPRLAEARPHWRLTLLGDPAALGALPFPPGADVRLVEARAPIYSLHEQLELPRIVPRSADLFWSPHYPTPLAHRGRLLVTVHDLFHLAVPSLVDGLARRAYARAMFEVVRRRAARVLFDSAFSRDEFLRLVGRPRAADVVHLGVSPAWHGIGEVAPRARGRPYLLYVGNVKPHKNVPTLVRAFMRLHDRVPHDLVIVGRVEGMRTADHEVARLAAASGGRVQLAGEVDDATLRAAVAGADAFALASRYEGFGLPPLEAMAAGVPCLVSRAASLPEVCGEAAHYCDPDSEDDVSARLHELLTDGALRDRLRARGRDRAAAFTWERCAERTATAIEETLAA